MEAPQLAPPPLSATAAATVGYADSLDCSPRSRNADSWDEQPFPAAPAYGGAASKLRLMCSYGGHIVPRPHDKVLCYVGGDTRIVVSDRNSTLGDLSNRLSKTLLGGRCFTLKYQLPNEDLDSLISITSDEDLENMIDEYDRLAAAAAAANNPQKSSRLRLFLFPTKPDSASSIGSLLENSSKSEDWFLNALNGANGGFSESASVNSLLGLEFDSAVVAGNGNSAAAAAKEAERNSQLESFGNGNKLGPQDVQSVPGSPLMEKNSSFDSTSSAPALANLPPIRVHVDDRKPAVGTIEDQFAQISVSSATQKQDDGGFVNMSSPLAVLTSAASPIAPAPGMVASGEYPNRVADDERSEQGLPMVYRVIHQAQPQVLPQQLQQSKVAVGGGGGVELGSPDSVSSDGSFTNPLSRQRPVIYQDPSGQNTRVHVYPVDPKLSDPNLRVQMQQFQDSGYVIPTQMEQFNQQQNHQYNLQQQQQLNSKHQQEQQQHQQLQQHQQQQQQPPLFQGGGHYIQHHPAGAVPMSSYYPVFPPQQQPLHQQIPVDQQYQMYYLPPRQPQAYNLPVQQPNYTDSAATVPSNQTQAPPSAVYAATTTRNAPASLPETAAGMYRKASPAPHLVQVPSSQRQPQYIPGSAAYEFVNPVPAQMYYTHQQQQPLAPQMYQTMTSAPMVGLAEASSQLPSDNVKQQQQQVRTLQP